jgi:hypothetical protein
MQSSSNDFICVTNEYSASGRFLQLARNGQVVAVSEVIQNRVSIARKLAEVEGQLSACNDPARLAELAIFCSTRKRDFELELRKVVANLEARKCRLLARLHQIDQRLDQEELSVEWVVNPAPMTSLVPRLVRESDPFVAQRNEIIDENINLSTLKICKILDRNFARDGYCDHLPKSWALRCKVQNFIDSYRNSELRNNVQKMISVRRRRLRRYPSA